MRRRRRHWRRQRTGGHFEAVRARIVASRRRNIAADVRLLADSLPNIARPAMLVAVFDGVRRGHVQIQHALVARLLRLRPQEVVQKIKALCAARSCSGGRAASLYSTMVASFSNAPALFGIIQLMSVTLHNVSLVELDCWFAILVQPAADLRLASNLTKLSILPVNVSTGTGYSCRVGRRLLIARLTARPSRFLAEVITFDHGYAHVMRQGILADVRATASSDGSP